MPPASGSHFKIGVISDTHNFLDPRVPGLLKGVRHILHAGDIGSLRLILDLEKIAPVTAVGGNTDDPAWSYSITEVGEVGGVKFLLQHIVNPFALTDSLTARLKLEKPGIVVFGHTHKPFAERIGNTLFFNPGYAGKSRFGLQRSLALLHCSESGQVRPEFLNLD